MGERDEDDENDMSSDESSDETDTSDFINHVKDEEQTTCRVCKASRWKLNKKGDELEEVPAKVLWYFPPIPRLRNLFNLPHIAKDMTWHDTERQKDGHTGEVQPAAVTGLLRIVQIRFSGLLVCAPNGNPPPSGGLPGVAGAVLSGSCNGATGNLGMAITDINGFYSGILTLADGLLFDPSQGVPCFLTVQLPLVGTTCQVFPPTGTLRAPLQLVSVITNLVGGIVLVANAGPYQYVA
ncbi:hypothetical protein AgCh_020163 [Apium graveolens]